MGTDARDWFVEGHWFFLPSTYLALNWTWTTRYYGSYEAGKPYVPGTAKEEVNRLGASFVGWFTKNVRAEAEVAWGKVKNPGGQPVGTTNDASVSVALSYQVGRGR